MSNASDFIIENGVLTKYVGPGGDVVIPAGVTEIKNGSFARGGVFTGNKNIKTVIFPYGLINIGDYAFQDCSSLEKIEIPNTVKRIGWFAFSKCSKIKTLDLPDDLQVIEEAAFEELRKIKELKVPAGVQRLSAAFWGCSKLEKLILNEGLREIDTATFRNCAALTEVVLPDSIETIGDDAFRKCKKLRKVVIPASVKTLGNGAFRDCPELTEIILPAALSPKLKTAFDKMDLLKKEIQGKLIISPEIEKAFISQIIEKSSRKRLMSEWISEDNAENVSWLLSHLKKPVAGEIVEYFDSACRDQKPQVQTVLQKYIDEKAF